MRTRSKFTLDADDGRSWKSRHSALLRGIRTWFNLCTLLDLCKHAARRLRNDEKISSYFRAVANIFTPCSWGFQLASWGSISQQVLGHARTVEGRSSRPLPAVAIQQLTVETPPEHVASPPSRNRSSDRETRYKMKMSKEMMARLIQRNFVMGIFSLGKGHHT